MTLEWLDNSNDEVGFEIYRSTGLGSFWPYDETGPNRTTWTDDDVESGVNYRYKVRALLGDDPTFGSAFSNAVSYSWHGLTKSNEPLSYPAASLTLDGVLSSVAATGDLFKDASLEMSTSSTDQPVGIRDDMRLVAPGITFSVPKNQLDLDAPGGAFLVFPRWDITPALGAYAWVVISTRSEPVEFVLPYDAEHPGEPVEIRAAWLAELEAEFGLGSDVRISVYPVAQTGGTGPQSLAPQVINQDFGLFEVNAADVANDSELEEECAANRAVFNTGRVGRSGDPQDIGDRIPLVLVHGWQVLANQKAGADPFDNFFKESKFAPHICDWLDFIGTYWLAGAGKLYDITSEYALYTFSYDSDKHIIENATELDAYLESAFGDRPAVVVAHSMGGMVASTVQRMVDSDDPTPSISNIISFGTPYRGTPALACVERATISGVPVCARARIGQEVSGSYILSSIFGFILKFDGTVDLASEVGSGMYLRKCEKAPGPFVVCTEWIPGIDNPFLAELNDDLPDGDTHHALVGQLEPESARCVTPRWVWAAMDQSLDCVDKLLYEAYGYLTDGIVPMASGYFSHPFAPGEQSVLPHDVYGGVNHVDLHKTSGPLHGAMRVLRDLAHGDTDGSDLLLTGHTGPITSASFSPDGARILTTSEDATARVWDATSGSLLFMTDSHTAAVNAAVVWADGSTIMTGSSDGHLKQWDASGNEMWSSNYGIGIFSMDINLNSRYFAVGVGTSIMYMNPRPLVYLVDLDDGDNYKQLGSTALEGFYHDVMFSGDGELLVTALAGVYSGAANVWETATGEVFLELESTYPVRTVAISTDGNQALAVSTIDGDVTVWDVPAGEPEFTLDPPSGVNDSVFSPDGSTILVACDDGNVRLYDAKDGTLKVVVPTGMPAATVANFSPDGSRVLVGSEDGEVIVFSL